MMLKRALLLAGCAACIGGTVVGCSASTDGSATDQSQDPLLSAAARVDGGNACAACIQQSCGSELSALEAELKTLETQATHAFSCVRDNRCLSLFWTDRDAGRAAASACIMACDVDAGLPGRDAARSAVTMLADAVDQCVDMSCVSPCPGAANDRDDRDGAMPPRPAFDAALPPGPPFGASFPHCDAGIAHFDGGALFPPPPAFEGRR